MRQNKNTLFYLGQMRTGPAWWFSIILRTGLDWIFSDQDWTRTENPNPKPRKATSSTWICWGGKSLISFDVEISLQYGKKSGKAITFSRSSFCNNSYNWETLVGCMWPASHMLCRPNLNVKPKPKPNEKVHQKRSNQRCYL